MGRERVDDGWRRRAWYDRWRKNRAEAGPWTDEIDEIYGQAGATYCKLEGGYKASRGARGGLAAELVVKGCFVYIPPPAAPSIHRPKAPGHPLFVVVAATAIILMALRLATAAILTL